MDILGYFITSQGVVRMETEDSTFLVQELECQSQIPDDKAGLKFSKLDTVLDVIQ